MLQTIIDHAFQMARVGIGIFRRTPNARNTENSAAALGVVIWAVHFAPSMTSADFNTPPVAFCMANRPLDFFIRMPNSSHFSSPNVITTGKVVK